MRPLQIINIVSYAAIIIINILSNTGVIGETNKVVSDKYASYFTPAGYAFSIWGLIFTALGIFVIYQALSRNKSNPKLDKVHLFFMFSALAMIGWVFSFNNEVIWLSMIMIFLTWLPLAFVYFRLNAFGILTPPNYGSMDYWMINWPFILYFAWLTVANVANFFILAVDMGWASVNTPLSSSIAIAIVSAVGLAMLLCYSDIFFVMVVFWAVMAIRVKHISSEIIATAALTCFVVLTVADAIGLIILLVKYFREKKKNFEKIDEEYQHFNY
jgi:hypothetical protein